MKRTILFAAFIISVLFSGLAAAQETNPCQNSDTRRDINLSARGFAFADLQTIFETILPNEIRCLLFSGTLRITGRNGLVLDIGQSFGTDMVRDVYIDGANLTTTRDNNSDLPLLTIINNTTNRVIVTGLQMTNVKNGLKLEGSGLIEIRGPNTTIAGNSELRTGACIETLSDNTKIISSTISNCEVGVKIAASHVFLGAENPSTYGTDKNTFSGNSIGIHRISGTGNKWPFNSISGGDGIVVVDGVMPVIHREGDIVTLACKKLEGASNVNSCEIQFDSLAEISGEVEVYKTNRNPPVDSQGEYYIARCAIEESNKCIFDAANALALTSNIMCGDEKCYFTAIQTDGGSSMYTTAFKLDFIIESTIISSPTTLPVETSGMTGGGDDGVDAGAPEFENPVGDGGPSSVPIGTGERSAAGEPGGGVMKTVGAKMACNMISGGDAGDVAALLVCLFPFCVLLAARIGRRT